MQIIIRLVKQIGKYKFSFFFAIIGLTLATVGNLYTPLIIRNIIDNIITPSFKSGYFDMDSLNKNVLLFVVLVFLSEIVGFISKYALDFIANKVGQDLRDKSFEVMQKLPVSYFSDKPAGKISTLIVNYTETLRAQFYIKVLQAFSNLLPLVIILVILYRLNKVVALLMLLLLPLIVIWQRIYSKLSKKNVDIFYEAQSEMNSQVAEIMNSSSTVQLYQQIDNTRNRFKDVLLKLMNSDNKTVKIDASLSWTLSDVLNRLVLFAILLYVGLKYLGGVEAVSAGLLLVYTTYMERIFERFNFFVRLLPDIQRSLSTGKLVFEFLDTQLEEETDNKILITDGNVEFKNVSFEYVENTPVLNDISFKANKGETIALVGHTGSGKSSIINLLFRFYDLKSGEILIDGQNIQNYSRESIRKNMGIVLQEPYIFSGTVSSNISMNVSSITKEETIQALEKVGGKFIIDKLDNGIDSIVSERGSTFSSGERQLISFARALAANPKILILDEATSHIDTETEEIISYAMNVLKKGRTTFIIAHRLSTVSDADKIIVLDKGKIVEIGNHQELMNKNGYYAHLYNSSTKINIKNG